MTVFPPIDGPNELRPFLLEVQRQLEAKDALIEAQGRQIAQIERQLGTSSGEQTTTNNTLEKNRLDIIELWDRAPLPAGGGPGDTVTRGSDGLAVWTSTPYAVVPEYWVTLEQGAPVFSVNRTLDEDNIPLPPVEFIDDGRGFSPITSGFAQAPINLSVTVVPHADDDDFTVSLPLVGGSGGGSPAYFVLALYNSSAFRARVDLGKQGIFSGGSILSYAGTQTMVYTPGEDTVRVLEPGEFVNWWVQLGGQDSFNGVVTPLPVQSYVGDSSIGFADSFYCRTVASMRRHETWSARGTLAVADDDVPVRNGTGEVLVLGKVVVSLGVASAGADVQVVIKRNGASVFTTPLAVPAGTLTGSKVPDVFTHTAAGAGVAGFAPGDRLTAHIVQVGSTGTEGEGITIQVYFG